MSFTRRPGSGRPRESSHREDRHIVRNAHGPPTASSAANCVIGRQRGTALSLGAPESSRTILRRLAEGHLRSRCPLRVLPLTLTHRCLHLQWCRARRNWTAAEWNQVVFRDKSRFSHSSDDNHVRVWRPRDKHLNPAFTLQRHIAPTAGVTVWGAIAYNTRSPLVLIHVTMTAQWRSSIASLDEHLTTPLVNLEARGRAEWPDWSLHSSKRDRVFFPHAWKQNR
ncbi:transposable element Tcb2 transposase [Trichonephila clavipes]|nr:transposable element Tcb2 transposase [Trichonephila clavipes]